MSLSVLTRSARYIAPIAVLSAIVMAPVVLFAFSVPAPANPKQASIVLRIVWLCAASGLLSMLLLVGALAPIVRSEKVSQFVALGRGLRGLVRAIVPGVIVVCAVAMGLLALAVPGLLLYGVLVFAPASEADGVHARLVESMTIVRARWRSVAIVIALTILALVALVVVQQLLLPIPLGKSPPRAQLVLFPQMVRFTALAMVGIVPVAAVSLAAIYASTRSRMT